MIVSISYMDPKEKSMFKISKDKEIEINSLKDVETFILDNDFKFNNLSLIDGELKTRPAEMNENLSGKLIRFNNSNYFELASKMIIGRELEKTNLDIRQHSYIPGVEVANGTWDRLSHVTVVDYNFTTNNQKVLNRDIMINEEYEKLYSQYETIKKTMSFTGHRPHKLGGYSTDKETFLKNKTMKQLKPLVQAEIEYYINEKGVEYFITGGALGLDQLAFWAILELKKKYPHIKNILAIPFDGFEKRWKKIDKHWYHKMYKFADSIILVSNEKEYEVLEEDNKLRVIQQLQKRNEYMVDFSYYTLAVYDGTKGGTRNCINYARKLDREIRVLNPSKDFEAHTLEKRFVDEQETLL